MDALKDLLSNKRNLVGLIIAVVLLVALPVGLYLVRTQQIFKPKASFSPITISGFAVTEVNSTTITISGIVHDPNGSEISQVQVWGVRDRLTTPPASTPDGDFELIGEDTSLSNIGDSQGFSVTWVPDASDAGDWYIMVDVTTADGDVCSGWSQNGGALHCSGLGEGSVTVEDQGGGGTDLNLRLTLGNCSGSSRTVNLNWNEIDGATSYRVTADAATIGNVTTLYSSSNELVNSQRQFTITALNSSGGQIPATNGSKSIHVDPCTTTVGFSCSNLCSTPIDGGTITSQGECYQQCLGNGTVNLVVTPSGTCNANNQTVVHLSWSPPPNTTGNSYQVLRDNIVIDVTSNLTKDDTTNPGTHTYRVNAISGNTPTGNGQATVNITCGGTGGTCSVNGPSSGTTGQSVGNFSVSGLPAGNYGCSWFVFGGTATYQPTQNCSFPFSFTPSTPGTYTVRSSATISTTNTLTCSTASVNVTSITGGYACNSNNQCVATIGGPFGPGCGTGCGGVNPPQNCTATVTCSGPCVLNQPNTCNSGNGTATQCVYTTLSNGSADCTQVAAANSVCAAGEHCDTGNTCTIPGGGTGGLCVPTGGFTPPPNPTPSPPISTTPNKVKIANKLSTDASCVTALSSSRAYFRDLAANQTTIELQHTLTDSAPGTKTVCAQFYNNTTPFSPPFENSIQIIGTQVSPTPSASPTACTSQNRGDALIAGQRDGMVDLLDFNEWRDEFLFELSHGPGTSSKGADFYPCDNKVDLLDFNTWRDVFISSLGI